MLKRFTDIVFSLSGIVILSPLLLAIAVMVGITSPGGVIYRQRRVGKGNVDFFLYKFRTMRPGSDRNGLLTIGGNDPRVTSAGRFLRRFKLDELPQLFNVLNGSMSLVGPRPEVRKYVELYSNEQKRVLQVKPGITDYASLTYFEENDLLARSDDPESAYVREVLPAKLELNLRYIRTMGFTTDMRIIFATLARIAGIGKKRSA